MDATSQKIKDIGGSMAKSGAKWSLAVTTPIVVAGKKMINAASDYEENLNKIDVAFANSADVVKEWGNNATKQFGLSKNQALEATALFGDMATSMGLSHEEAADMSMSLAGLAGDLASFKNIGVDQAMTALNGVFTGETESLKTLGVVMTDTNLNAYALEKGMGKTTDQMSQAEKVQLRYAYIMDMTKNAQGDYARTSDGTANSLRTFQGAVDNLNIALGQHLLPVLTPLVQKATALIDKFAEADPKTQQLVLKIAALAAVIGPVLVINGTLISSVGNIIGVFGKASDVISGAGKVIGWLTSPMGLTMAAIVALIAIGYLLISNWDTIKAIGSDVWLGIQSLFQMFDNYLTGIFTTDWTQSFGIFGNILNGFFANVSNIWNAVKRIFSGITDFVAGIFTGDWSRAWRGVINIFGGIWDGLEAIAKAPLNGLISLVNAAIGGLNSISVTIPNWVPKYGGRSFGISIPTVPYLYHGTDNWQGGFAYMNEGGRGELTYLPDGTQVIPHDISEKYAKESARMNRGIEPIDFSGILEGVTILVDASTSVDGTQLKELAAEYTIRKIGNQQRAILRAKGAHA
ncbi:phage tail tape measure protein, partial [Frisingicoccus sp.]|uniref:phage tail tape measure protein n=1 Tax=Frisingicoccus sp. TaxID=1918627 RepID=UPI00399247CD